MSFVHRLDPGDIASSAVRLDDESIPVASSFGTGLELCPRCGAPNGITALNCWRCEAELSPAGPVGAASERGPDAGRSERLEQPPRTDRELAHDRPLGSLGSDPASGTALGDPAERTAPPAVRAPAGTDAGADSRYPILTQVVEGDGPLPARSAHPALVHRGTRQVVAAAVVLLALVGAGVYLYLPALRTILNAPLSRDAAAGAGAIDGNPVFVAPMNADPTNTGATQASQADATRSALGEAIDAATRALSAKPNTPADVQAAPLAVSPTNSPAKVLTRPKATPPANTSALTEAQRGKVRGTKQSANAAAAAPLPDRLEPTRQTPVRLEPCTATVAALGLCTATPIDAKE